MKKRGIEGERERNGESKFGVKYFGPNRKGQII